MTPPLPICTDQWREQVVDLHAERDADVADGAGIELDRYEEEAAAHLHDLISNHGARIRMRVDSLERFIREGAFRNHSAGGDSAGDPDRRLQTESTVLGLDLNASPDDRPIYGYLYGADEKSGALNSYGSARLVLSDSVLLRATIVLGDSIGSTQGGTYPAFLPDPFSDPTILCSFCNGTDLRQVASIASATDPYFRYAELQIYGGLRPDDIMFITFSQGHQAGEDTMAELRRLGIGSVVIPGNPT